MYGSINRYTYCSKFFSGNNSNVKGEKGEGLLLTVVEEREVNKVEMLCLPAPTVQATEGH